MINTAANTPSSTRDNTQFVAGRDLAEQLCSASSQSLHYLWRLLCAEINLSKTSIGLVLITLALISLTFLTVWLGILALTGVLLVTAAGWSLPATLLLLIFIQLPVIAGLISALRCFTNSIGIEKSKRLVKLILGYS